MIIALLAVILIPKVFGAKAANAVTVTYTTETVQRRDISTELSASGAIEPLNIYEITTLVRGEIIKADFEAGDYVEEL